MSQGLVALQTPAGADKQPEAVVETVADLACGHRRHPRRRQLDGQRNAVETTADLRGSPPRRQSKSPATTLRARSTNRSTAVSHIQRTHSSHLLVGEPKSFAAGRQDSGCRRFPSTSSIRSAAASRTCSQLSNTSSRILPSSAGGHRLRERLARLLRNAEHRSDRVGNRRWIRYGREFEKPYTVRKFVAHLSGGLQSQPGLPHPADAGQSDKPMCAHGVLDLGNIGFTPDEAGGRRSQVARGWYRGPAAEGNSSRRPVARTWNSPTGVGTSRSRRGPRSRRSTPLTNEAVESATRI